MSYVIALDGPSGTGKSSTAKEIATRLSIAFLDTGAMYRSLSLLAMEAGIEPGDAPRLSELALTLDFEFPSLGQVMVNGRDVSTAIRLPEVSARVSPDCQPAAVRQTMVQAQRHFGSRFATVLDGRDIGTVVFPDARFKFYIDCDPAVRARRRVQELEAMGKSVAYEEVLANLLERDHLDSTRAVGPLRKAQDAILVDTSSLTFPEQVEAILSIVEAGLAG
jgi:cytidylate kinase